MLFKSASDLNARRASASSWVSKGVEEATKKLQSESKEAFDRKNKKSGRGCLLVSIIGGTAMEKGNQPLS